MNAVGREMDANRQVELLRSFSKQLRESVSEDQKQTQRQIAELANKLDALQELITEKKEDEKTAQHTQAALNGSLGDSIAALDFTRAQAQLDSIQAKLEVIGGDVKVTRDNTQVIKETLEAREAREKATADAEARKAKEIDEDPNMYTRAQIMPLGITPLHYMVFFNTGPLYPPFIAYRSAWHSARGRLRVWMHPQQVGGKKSYGINFDSGRKATICFVAHDRPSGRFKEWMQHYNLTPLATRAGDVNFIPDGDAIMRLTDGGPCDGVTQVRQEATAVAPVPAAPQPSVADQYKDQMAQLQQRMADMRAQARKTGPQAYSFATIRAEGTRRDHVNGDRWQIKVDMQPWPRAQLFDVHVQANLINASGQITPLQLSNRQLFVNIESRYATVVQMGTKAVICVTAKDPQYDKSYRLTQWFSIETSRVYRTMGEVRFRGIRRRSCPLSQQRLRRPVTRRATERIAYHC